MQPATVAPNACRRPEPFEMRSALRTPRRRGLRGTVCRRSAPTTRDTDFGDENVASNPDTAFTTRPSAVTRSTSERPSRVPETGHGPPTTSQRLGVHVARQSERGGLLTRPHPGDLPRRAGQVLRVVRRRLRRRRRIDRAHPQHQTPHPMSRPISGTCLQKPDRADRSRGESTADLRPEGGGRSARPNQRDEDPTSAVPGRQAEHARRCNTGSSSAGYKRCGPRRGNTRAGRRCTMPADRSPPAR